MSWDELYAATRAILINGNIRMYAGWRVCDPTSGGPVLSAVMDHAKFYRVGDLELSNYWSDNGPQLVILATDDAATIDRAVDVVGPYGEVCALVPNEWYRGIRKHRQIKPDVLLLDGAPGVWLVFGPGRGGDLMKKIRVTA